MDGNDPAGDAAPQRGRRPAPAAMSSDGGPSAVTKAGFSFRVEAAPPVPPAPPRRPLLRAAVRWTATLVLVAGAAVIGLAAWQYYVTSPWTRNGAVRVQMASIAPQVSGQIVSLAVVDNQYVRKGDLLYAIDPFDFETAMRTAQAEVDRLAADLQVKQAQSARRQKLSTDATTPEEQQVFAGNALQAKAAYDSAVQLLAQAKLNLDRTRIVSPVNGYVTNLLLRPGDYAVAGRSNVSVIDADSFWIDGYFEETKLARICVGDRAEAKLLGYDAPIVGHVETVTRGISVANAEAGIQGLPSVDPVYTWVRLAQRVPVRIAIDVVPEGVPLVSGLTATVAIDDPAGDAEAGDVVSRLGARLVALVDRTAPRPDCLQSRSGPPVAPDDIPVPTEPPAPLPQSIDPGLAPGLDVAPRSG